jgi:hypothetical protein
LTKLGYSKLDCKYNSEELTEKCDTTSGNYSLSLEFYLTSLESVALHFPSSDWEQQVGFFTGRLGEPTDSKSDSDEAVMTWQSQQTTATACPPPNEEG